MDQNQESLPNSKTVRSHSRILIIGAGDACISTIRMFKGCPEVPLNQIKVLDPSRVYHYQSLRTVVGGGLLPPWATYMDAWWMFPRATNRVYSRAQRIFPNENYVRCEDGTEHSYDVLIIAPGLELRGDLIKGLEEALKDPNVPVGSNYWLRYAEKYGKLMKDFRGGEAIFTQPAGIIKCGGAPQKIMYLSCSTWNGWLPFVKKMKYTPTFYTAGKSLFGVPYYREALEKVAQSYHIDLKTEHDLVEVDGKNNEAVFKNLATGELVRKRFDIMHVTPPQRAPKFIEESGLAAADGFVDVDKYTLQHKQYANIFALGDAASLPTSKTASTLNEEVHVVYENIISYLKQQPLKEQYSGYTACPIFVGRGKVMLCEFGYDNKIMPTFSKNPREPNYVSFILKTILIPAGYIFCGPRFIRTCRLRTLSLRDKLDKCFRLRR